MLSFSLALAKPNNTLPNIYQRIRFLPDGNQDFCEGKVIRKHRKNSVNKNIIGILFDDGSTDDYDFSKDVVWKDAKKFSEDSFFENFKNCPYTSKGFGEMF